MSGCISMQDGVAVTCKTWNEGIHVFQISEPVSTKTCECLADVAHFIQTILHGRSQAASGVQSGQDAKKRKADMKKYMPLSAPKPRHTKPVARPLSLWVLVVMMLPGLLWVWQSLWKLALYEASAIIGYAFASWRLRQFHKRLYERLQERVHERINKLYMNVYNGQTIDHPYGTKEIAMDHSS
mmetsp:Transcript_2939/g.18461  ORF Transcript_2939/g.18461 Transcript_2939/m.18461 type:complete len:183 (-) Transcript_2939:2527-3075(-)